MIAKKFYCDKEQGNIEIRYSKAEVGRTGIIAQCDYTLLSHARYCVIMSLGCEGYEKYVQYKTMYFTCNYSDLKKNLINCLKRDLLLGASAKINSFIDNVVKPVYIVSSEEVGTIFEVIDKNYNKFHVEVYNNRTEYYIEAETGSGRKKIDTIDKSQGLGGICRYISDKKLEKQAYEKMI
ncbi:MAG: hypothetical protein HDR05_12390 [Lachnospiraceae bacterium]|nr:hypothetical protein [Lachnospiraceae bacterium]